MKIALYKGRRRFVSKLICYWTQSPYSHVELVFGDGMCGSSHDLDLGVRLKYIDFRAEQGQWDFFEVHGDERTARQWFEKHSREPYDYLGLLSFIIPIKNNPHKWTCVKAVLTALGYDDAWRFEPSMLPAMLKGPCKNDICNSNSGPGVESMAVCGTLCTTCSNKDEAAGSEVVPEGERKRPTVFDPGSCGSSNCAVCSSWHW